MPLTMSALYMVGLAQLVSASGCGPEGRGFESHISPQKTFSDEVREGFYFFTLHFSLNPSEKVFGR